MQLFNYARSTQIPLADEAKKIGWSSGHRIEQLHAESWATASVYSYAQALRRLIGVWTREEAVKSLNRLSTFLTTDEADTEILNRGDTWPYSKLAVREQSGVAEQLLTLFVNPTRNPVTLAPKADRKESRRAMDAVEPDGQVIQERQARSAILFGPPGTSKTRLARAVAGAIGWQYIELHASHFVAAGLPEVQRTADDIFQKLMELDHTVVLFDEIDELVRERDAGSDAFGRFLTTSMLPKLAELWKQRKVIYFVATNHIKLFDRAVTRTQRFDALVFVTPPSFRQKAKRIRELLSEIRGGAKTRISVSSAEIHKTLARLDRKKSHDCDSLPDSQVLAKFIMLRYDQLDELAVRINEEARKPTGRLTVSRDLLSRALRKISDPALRLHKTYSDYMEEGKYLIKDYSKDTVWEVENLEVGHFLDSADYEGHLSVSDSRIWLTCVERPEKLALGPYTFKVTSPGCVRATPRRKK
jgi:hypothetical protein